MSQPEIRQANENDQKEWDWYVERHPDFWPYHLFAWKQAVEDAYGFKGNYLLAKKKSQIVGVFPQILMGIPFFSKNFVSLPYCDVGGLLADSEDVAKALLDKAVSLAADQGAMTINLRGSIHPGVLKILPYKVQKDMTKVRMILALPETSEDLWGSFKSKLRSQIRKAEKNGLVFQFSRKFTDFYDVFSENMRDLGSPVHSKKWIESVMNKYGDKARMGLVYLDQLPVGAGIILISGKKVSIPWASTLQQYNRLSPNMLLYWNFLKFSADHGYSLFDFGRSTPNEGTYRFKAQWGAKPEALEWHMICLGRTLPALNKDTSKRREHIAHIWQKLPLGLANFAGPVLRKFISL